MAEREPHERWFTRGTGMGVLFGLVLGLLLGDIIVGLMIGVILGAGIGVLANPRKDRRGDGPDRRRDERGAIDRGILWLLAGLAGTLVIVLVVAPELLAADAGQLGQLLAVVMAAAVPGLAIVLVLAYRRRHDHDDEEI